MTQTITRTTVINRMTDLITSFLPEEAVNEYFGNTTAEWSASDATQTTVQAFFQLLHVATPEQKAVWRTIAAAILSDEDDRHTWDLDAPYNVLARKYCDEALFKSWTALIGRITIEGTHLSEVRQFDCRGETFAQATDLLRYSELPEYASFREWRDSYGSSYKYVVIAGFDGTSKEHFAHNMYW